MIVIIGSIVAVFAVTAFVVLIVVNRKKAKENPIEEEPSTPASDCCGAHEVCEVDKAKVEINRVDYYEDEELDQLANIDADAYSDSQIDQFREVLYTLKVEEIQLWLISIERRNINLPTVLQDEARMLIVEG